ncbi:MAG: chromate efflux transporter, partial [Exiguobacterium sp.]|nr:chromate efflux transporter [Exiguobacterium sp.]MDX5426334.1 chromate efflux transporter [Exiguobacterium sp.]MDX6773707.1 chromate efflux transporter [Exiguobacterium sp.]
MEKQRVTLKTLLEILFVSTRLGLTSFGGPIAHLGYFHEEYVRRRKWIDEKAYADLVALCQFLPGPASSQVGIGIGILRGGILGGITSFIGFTAPSVIALIVFALFVSGLDVSDAGWLYGLKVVAVAIVAHAILGMAGKLTPDAKTRTIAFFALAGALLVQTAYSQVLVIVLAALAGFLLFKPQNLDVKSATFPLSKRLGAVLLGLFGALLVILPILRETIENQSLAMFDSFYRAGALVFGGGHVVLPLLERELVPAGFLSEEAFLAGYGAAQAVPGPLFTFASYLGTVINGVPGGLLATFAIFLPAFLLILGALPFWNALRRNPK